ncbi:hypothetical protein [Burkholderia cenocepacia]|nr:hypothetical protein [Burkholderia cenocepacia]EPZ89631.1 hypothetical protein BURCENK562V_C2507 [Burkholderia cenocepacia K56-2Valvano]ERI32107.1 hypothetical protein BURCENBC7_AP3778 [Burkholderia cenocepacia BC7]MBR8137826.1 hypothetical protein [Burkholderia cenocepacia]MCW3541470.1 hypothetical protein [Burkholderia cenocepacia]MCW3657227.1 hypothetical protein [Burkholderia cenocepacia]
MRRFAIDVARYSSIQFEVIDLADIDEQGMHSLKRTASGPPFWLAMIWIVLGLPALAFAGFFGYSTASCSSFGDALNWALFLSAFAVMAGVIHHAPSMLIGLVVCAAAAAIVRRFQRIEVTWIGFLVTLTGIYFAAAIVGKLMDSHWSCSLF